MSNGKFSDIWEKIWYQKTASSFVKRKSPGFYSLFPPIFFSLFYNTLPFLEQSLGQSLQVNDHNCIGFRVTDI